MKKSEEYIHNSPDARPTDYRPRGMTGRFLYVAVRRAVMRGQELVATAVSHSFAKKIAEALNRPRY